MYTYHKVTHTRTTRHVPPQVSQASHSCVCANVSVQARRNWLFVRPQWLCEPSSLFGCPNLCVCTSFRTRAKGLASTGPYSSASWTWSASCGSCLSSRSWVPLSSPSTLRPVAHRYPGGLLPVCLGMHSGHRDGFPGRCVPLCPYDWTCLLLKVLPERRHSITTTAGKTFSLRRLFLQKVHSSSQTHHHHCQRRTGFLSGPSIKIGSLRRRLALPFQSFSWSWSHRAYDQDPH